MPVCAENATEKLACFEMFSATIADEALSISNPPYSSGISIAVSPSSAASFSKRFVTEKSFASIESDAGIISLTAKLAVVSAICLCSSVKSSGKKQSAGAGSLIRKLPPAMRVAVVGSGVVIVAMVLLLLRILNFQKCNLTHFSDHLAGLKRVPSNHTPLALPAKRLQLRFSQRYWRL